MCLRTTDGKADMKAVANHLKAIVTLAMCVVIFALNTAVATFALLLYAVTP